ncbi:hypothetical protein ACO0SA_004141 [Hanseniaspora valbyensis]
MNGLFELDSKWKNIIDYDNTFLKEYQTGANSSADELVVAFLNDVCNSLDQDMSSNKFIDPKPYIRLLENCNKEINKKLANNSLDSYKYKNEQIAQHEKQFNKLVTDKLDPNFQILRQQFNTIEKKLNKNLTNNSVNVNSKDLSKGLLNLIQSLQLSLEKNNKYTSNIKLLKHYEFFYKLTQTHNFNNDDELEDIYDSFVLPMYKFEITELDTQQLERQTPINKEMSIVLTRLSKLATKLEKNNTTNSKHIEKINKMIFFTKNQFEKCIMDDFTLLYENLCNNDDGEHDEDCIYQCLNLIISLWSNMQTDSDSLIDVFVEMHPFLKKLHLEEEKSLALYSSILGQDSSTSSTLQIPLDKEFHDSKFESFLMQILKVINKEIDIIGKIFTTDNLFLETCNKFIKKIMLTKVKPVCDKIISFAMNNLQAIQYCKIIQSLYNFLLKNLAPIADAFNFVDTDIEFFIKKELLLNFNKQQFQLYLNKSLNLLATKFLKNISTQQIAPSSLNDLKNLLKKNENKNYMSVLNELNNSSNKNIGNSISETTEDNASKLLNLFGQRTLTQFNSLLKHSDSTIDGSNISGNDTHNNILEFNDGINKALKLQSKKDYIITNSNKKRTLNDAETTETFKIIINNVNNICSQFEETRNINNLLEVLLNNLYKLLLINYKKFEVNQAGGLIINSDIVNLYNTIEPYQSTVVNSTTLDNFKLLKELVAIFTMKDLNSVRYLIENSIYLRKNTNLNIHEYVKKRV